MSDIVDKLNFEVIADIPDMLSNYPLIQQLSPHLSEYDYQTYLEDMVPYRYFQVIAKLDTITAGVSGFHLGTKLYCGPYLEVDNLVVDRSYRGRGIGKALLDWMLQEAKQRNCHVIMLDAYLNNTEAHRLYEQQGYEAKGYHFIQNLRNPGEKTINHPCLG